MFAQQLTLKNANWSVEIVRSGFGACDAQRLNAFRFHGDDIVLILQASFDQQKLMMNDHGMILLEKLRRDDGIGDSGFVFQAEEDKTLGGAGALARDHGSGDAHMRAIWKMLEARWRSACLAASFRRDGKPWDEAPRSFRCRENRRPVFLPRSWEQR